MSRLERLAYICLITLSVVSMGILLEARFSKPKASQQAENPADPDMLTGKKLEVVGANWGSTALNAVVFLSTECHFCEESMPFYRRLVAERHGVSADQIKLVAVSAESVDRVKKYLDQKQVGFDGVYQIGLPNSLLKGTPTFLIVDQNGIIVRAVVGKLNSSTEDEMLNVVRTGKMPVGLALAR